MPSFVAGAVIGLSVVSLEVIARTGKKTLWSSGASGRATDRRAESASAPAAANPHPARESGAQWPLGTRRYRARIACIIASLDMR